MEKLLKAYHRFYSLLYGTDLKSDDKDYERTDQQVLLYLGRQLTSRLRALDSREQYIAYMNYCKYLVQILTEYIISNKDNKDKKVEVELACDLFVTISHKRFIKPIEEIQSKIGDIRPDIENMYLSFISAYYLTRSYKGIRKIILLRDRIKCQFQGMGMTMTFRTLYNYCSILTSGKSSFSWFFDILLHSKTIPFTQNEWRRIGEREIGAPDNQDTVKQLLTVSKRLGPFDSPNLERTAELFLKINEKKCAEDCYKRALALQFENEKDQIKFLEDKINKCQ